MRTDKQVAKRRAVSSMADDPAFVSLAEEQRQELAEVLASKTRLKRGEKRTCDEKRQTDQNLTETSEI